MGWTKACAVDALAPGTRQVVNMGGRKILVLNEGGELYAVENSCPHMKIPMKNGKIKDCTIVCPLHRSSFDLKSGAAVEWTPFPPGVGKVLAAISKPKAIAVFPTRVEDGNVWVEV